MINANTRELLKNIDDIIADDRVKSIPDNPQQMFQVAVDGKRMFEAFAHAKSQEVKKSSTALKSRLQSMIQSIQGFTQKRPDAFPWVLSMWQLYVKSTYF